MYVKRGRSSLFREKLGNLAHRGGRVANRAGGLDGRRRSGLADRCRNARAPDQTGCVDAVKHIATAGRVDRLHVVSGKRSDLGR